MKNFFEFKNVAHKEKAQLSIFDEISFWGVTAKDFHSQLKSVTAPVIELHINSPGGSVVDGYAIYNMLRAHAADIEVTIDGIAASIASVVAMAGDTIKMPENALMFLHNPLVNYVSGNADDLKKIAADLEKMTEGIISIYEARTGLDRKAIQKLLDEETLLTAKEAEAQGFADEIVAENRMAARFNAADFLNKTVVDRFAAAQAAPIPPVTPTGGRQDNKQQPDNMKFKTQDEAEARVAALEGENTTLKTSATDANTAHQTAINKAKTDESARKSGITALAKKHDKDGDLNAITVDALAGDTTVEAFTVKVLEVVNARPAKDAIKPNEGKGADNFEAKYKAAKTPAERKQLVAENRVEARRLARESGRN